MQYPWAYACPDGDTLKYLSKLSTIANKGSMINWHPNNENINNQAFQNI